MDFDPRDCDSRDEARWPDRDRESPDRAFDSREPFMRDLDLPRGLDREIVRDRDREYTLRGSETRTLATVGAFRVVSSRDLRDHQDRALDPRSSSSWVPRVKVTEPMSGDHRAHSGVVPHGILRSARVLWQLEMPSADGALPCPRT